MKIKEGRENKWASYLEKNTDSYGGGIIKFAEIWADMMEVGLANGEKLADIAKDLSFKASKKAGGITGFMYGAGVAALSSVWEHGEELRRWHNLDTQLGDEGEKANKRGGTLNPALLSIGKD